VSEKDPRPFIKVTTDFVRNPKVLAMPMSARWALLDLWSHCADFKTDGVVDARTFNKIVPYRVRNELILHGFCTHDVVKKEFILHDYLKHQTSAAEQAEAIEKARAAGKRGGQVRAVNAGQKLKRPLSDGIKRNPSQEEVEEEKRTTGHLPEASHLSNATAGEPQNERPTGPAIKPDAARMVRDIIPRNQPAAVKTALRIKASELLVGGTEPQIVEQALHEWMTRTDVGPGILPSLVSGLLKAQDPRAAPKRALTKSERQFVELELMKDNPDPVALRQLGIDPIPTTNLRAINGGVQ
jgi:hypothetical protein